MFAFVILELFKQQPAMTKLLLMFLLRTLYTMKDVQYIYLSWRFFKARKRSNSNWQKLAHDLGTDVSFFDGCVATFYN